MYTPLLVYSIYTLYALAGLLAAVNIYFKPGLFWPILLAAIIITGGLMIQGYGLIDEYLLAMILFGGLLAIINKRTSLQKIPRTFWQWAHQHLFVLFVGYMLCQSIRGLLALNDLRMTRWIIYYLLLGILALIITRKRFIWPNPHKTILIIFVAGLIYFIAYLSTGWLYEILIRSSRYNLQGYLWAGSAAAMLPLPIALAAGFSLLKNADKKPKEPTQRKTAWLAWALIFIATIVANYYETRTGIIILLSFLVLSLFCLKFRQALFFFILYLMASSLFGAGIESTLDLSRVSIKSTTLRYESDSGRIMHLEAALDAIKQNPKTLFFGSGLHTNRLIIGPYLKQLGYFQDGPAPTIVHTTGLAALLIDTGLIGTFLFYSVIFLAGCQVLLTKHNPHRLSFLLIIIMLMFWPLITDIQDAVLLYLLIMPAGILVHLSRPETEAPTA